MVLGLIGAWLIAEAALRPTLEARGYVLAAIGWLGLFTTWWLAAERRVRDGIRNVLIAIGAGEALYGLIQAVGGVDQIGSYARGVGRLATGTYINRNHFAGLLNMTLALALGALYTGYVERRQRRAHGSETVAWTWLIIACCAAVGVAVFLSRSRAGSLTLVAMLFFVFVLLQAERRRHARGHAARLPSRVAALLLAATVALGLGYGINALMQRFAQMGEGARPQIYGDTLRMIGDHPWLGVGPGMYRLRFRAYQTVDLSSHFVQAHNDYLQAAAEWGIPLALLFWGFIVWRWSRAIRVFLTSRSPSRRGLALGCAAAIFTILVHSLVDFNLQLPANLLIFSIVLGLSWAVDQSANHTHGRAGHAGGAQTP